MITQRKKKNNFLRNNFLTRDEIDTNEVLSADTLGDVMTLTSSKTIAEIIKESFESLFFSMERKKINRDLNPRKGVPNRHPSSNRTPQNNNKKPNRKSSKSNIFMKILNRIPFVYVIAGAIIILILVAIFSIMTHKNAQEIAVDSVPVGIIKQKNITVEELTNTATSKIKSEIGTDIKINEEISIKPVHAKKKHIVTTDYLLSDLCNKLTYNVKASSLSIEGKEIAIVANKSIADNLLAEIASAYISEDADIIESETSFEPAIDIKEKFVKNEKIVDAQKAKDALTATKEVEKSYIVVDGDNLYKIAAKLDLKVSDILSVNPSLNENSIIRVGDEIKISLPVPLISVKTVEKITYEETIEKPINTIENNSQYKTYKKVIEAGKDGKREVTANVTKINGIEESSDVISEKILVEPIAETVEVGTLETPPKRAIGNFIYPLSGRITTKFGSGGHKGIDILGSYGAPVYASDGGNVTYSGFNNGGYGNLVIVTHNDGFQTYYAHNSQNAVSQGENVYQGQVIAYVGSTGNSTANHVHFEIRQNGTPLNPFSFIN